MTHRWWLAALLATGCGSSLDDRPQTFETVVLEILAPSCGQVQCHSTTTRTEGYAFDTLEAARPTLTELAFGGIDSELLFVLTTDDLEYKMPPDAPLPAEDIALIRAWLVAGNPGL